MQAVSIENNSNQITMKLRAYFELLKFRLSALVTFSGTFGYYLGLQNQVDWLKLSIFALAAFCLTGSSNIVNQIKEVEFDAIMKRTKGRPLPTKRLTVNEAGIFSLILFLFSISLLFFVFNYRAALLAILSFLLYSFVYTPLKRVGPISVFVGAFPGAFPPMIGWVAATGFFGLEPGILFAIQFFWQFPHFWAIAWVGDEDYTAAGFKMLPNGGKKDLQTAVTLMIYTIFLVPLGFVPYLLGMTGFNSAIVAVTCGILFLCQTFYLMKNTSDKAALMIMFGSFLYLPIVQIAYLLDKI
ncbi:MAG: heme o synthase [Bacteroidota bacterium]